MSNQCLRPFGNDASCLKLLTRGFKLLHHRFYNRKIKKGNKSCLFIEKIVRILSTQNTLRWLVQVSVAPCLFKEELTGSEVDAESESGRGKTRRQS